MEPGEDERNVADASDLRPRGQLFATLARALGDDRSEGPLALRLCRAFVKLRGAEGGAITLAYNEPQRTTLCATDATADRLEDLQDVLGEGPGPDAFASGERVEADLAGDDASRWPMLEESVLEQLGVLSVEAFPMRTQAEVLGVVTVYRRAAADPEPTLSPREAALIADALGAAILQQSGVDDETSSWRMRDQVHQATGMVVAQLAIAPGDALALMRAFAFSHGLPMDALASEIIERRQDFRDNEDFRGNGS